jgi:hypothetical protein
VDKFEPEFGGLAIQEANNILQVLDETEDVSKALLSRFDIFSLIIEYGNYAFLLYFNNISITVMIDQ